MITAMDNKTLRRFMEKHHREGECWVWHGALASKGYGAFEKKTAIGFRALLSHRVSYSHFKGPISGGLQIDHLCRNRRCVNPQHLEAVTAKENVLRGNGKAAKNARKTHCLRGHDLSFASIRMEAGRARGRLCLICSRIRGKAQRDKARK